MTYMQHVFPKIIVFLKQTKMCHNEKWKNMLFFFFFKYAFGHAETIYSIKILRYTSYQLVWRPLLKQTNLLLSDLRQTRYSLK